MPPQPFSCAVTTKIQLVLCGQAKKAGKTFYFPPSGRKANYGGVFDERGGNHILLCFRNNASAHTATDDENWNEVVYLIYLRGRSFELSGEDEWYVVAAGYPPADNMVHVILHVNDYSRYPGDEFVYDF